VDNVENSFSVVPMRTTRQGVMAFRVIGELDRKDMQVMAQISLMNFDQYGKIDMLTWFEH